MTKSRMSLSSSTYKSGIFEGFSRLQQSDEFVDMTLAADGHLVKVHQTLVALASPYLKDMLLSVPCKHPVIFLNGISHEMLGFILEYIYRGEVEIPADKVQSFLHSAQAMHIAGLKNIIPSADYENLGQEKQTKHVFYNPEKPPPAKVSFTIKNDENVNNFDLQLQEPVIEQPDEETESQKDFHLPCNIDIPTSLERNDGHEHLRNMNTCGKSINISYNNCVSDDNISQKPVANIEVLSNILINEIAMNDDFTIKNDNNFDLQLQEPIIESPDEETESQTDVCLPCNIDIPISLERNDGHENLRNMNTCGKSINISYNNSVSDYDMSQKPVANIEILSNTLINENIDAMNDQGQLPQLYTKALANMNKVIEGHNLSIDESVSHFLSISNQSSVQQSHPNSEPTGSDHVNNNEETSETSGKNNETDSILYTASNRGALQLILNRFMYYCHYRRDNGRKRRWRCIDYRDSHCPASIDTLGEEIVDRKHKHCHPNHDKKIRKKMAKRESKIFSTVKMAQDNLEN